MRSGQSKRMRGRSSSNNNRKGPNPLTRSYESNGPDVKIRGTASHIGEKYLQLARDAQSSGDPVMAESYLQHAEHYFRLIAAAQQAQQQAAYGYQRSPNEQVDDSDSDDDFDSLPDRFASPSERSSQPPQQNHQSPPQPFSERQPYSNNDRQPYEQRSDRQNGSQQPHYQDRSQGDRQDRPYDNRNGRHDRSGYQDRNYQDRGQDQRSSQDRSSQDRNSQDRNAQDRGAQDRNGQDRNGQDRSGYDRNKSRDYDNRSGYRGDRGRNYEGSQPRDIRDEQRGSSEDTPNGLPAFITGPTRSQTETEPQPEMTEDNRPASEAGDESGQHMRPRRRRRSKGDYESSEVPEKHEATASDPVGD